MNKILETLNWADGVLIVIFLVSIGFGIKRGLTREVLSLLSWLSAFVISYVFHDNLATLMSSWITTPSVRTTVAMVSLFAMTMIVGAMLNHVLADLLKKTGLTGTDRLLGVFFGAARGVVIAVALLLFVQSSFSLDPWWKQSYFIPKLIALGHWSQEMIDGIVLLTQSLTAKT